MQGLLNSFITEAQKLIASPMRITLWTLAFSLAGYWIQTNLPFSENGQGGLSRTVTEDPLVLQGQLVYQEEGCQYCHTQNLRPFSAEVKRYADPAKFGFFPAADALEARFQSPFPRGSVRIGPDLSRLAGRYTAESIRGFLKAKADNKARTAFHAYADLFDEEQCMSDSALSWRIRWMINAGVPLTDPYLQGAEARLRDQTRGDALVAYLASLGQKKMNYDGKFFAAQ